MTMTITPTNAPTADVEQLVARVAELEKTQQTEDVDGFLALFDADAVWVTGGGRRLVGREEIAAFTRQVLPGAMSDGTVRYEVDHIRFITPDVALTGVNQEYLTLDGRPLSPRQQGRPSYVWRRRNGSWLMACGQNTGVALDDAPEDGDDSTPALVLAHDDEIAIRGIVADVETGFNTNNVDLMVRHFAPDSIAVDARGVVLRGGDQITSTTRDALASGPLRDATAHYRVTDVTLLAPDVAVAHKSAWSTSAAADGGAPPEMNALYVLVRRGGRWWIVRRQNTLVAPTS